MDALVMAGQSPGQVDPLLEYGNARHKALSHIAGRPMIQWVVDALAGSRHVDRLCIVGLAADCGVRAADKPILFLPNQGRLLANLLFGGRRLLEDAVDRQRALICACDIPLITADIVDDHVETMLATSHAAYYTIVERSAMQARFPASRRTYTRMKDGAFCGGDLNMAGAAVLDAHQPLWDDLLEERKRPWRMARRVGMRTLLRFVTRSLTVADAERRAERTLGFTVRVVRTPHAELGMDVDKPFQLDIVRAELEGR